MTRRLLALTLLSSALACGGKGSGSDGSGGATSTGGQNASGTGGAGTASGGQTGSGGTVGSGGMTTGGSGGRGTASGGAPGTGGSMTTGTGGAMMTGSGGAMPMAGRSGSGTGGASSGGAGGGPPPGDGSNSVLERNNNPAHDGHFIQPTLTKANAAKMAIDAGFMATFTGNTWASPLYWEKGPGGKGIFIAVTFGNDVFALDETTGAKVWMKNIGTPATGNIGCNFDPGFNKTMGILSTPVIDASTGTLYVVGASGDSSGIAKYIMSALDIMTGEVKAGWPVDLSGKIMFDPKVHIQRSSLSLVGGIVYAAFGGFVGDCGDYRGRVVAVKASDPTMVAGWATGGRGEGIWPAGGLTSDGTSIYATTGNTTSGGPARANSESVIKLTGLAAFDKSTKSYWYPTNFASMDSADADLSASNPVFFKVPGAMPSNLIGAFSKDGNMYLLDADNLGGMGMQLSNVALSSGAMSLYATPTVYKSSKGVMVAVTAKGGSMCPSGGGSGALMAISVSAAMPPKATTTWCANVGSGMQHAISTSTDGTAEPIVWVMNGSKLNGFDGETGMAVTTGGSGTCANVRRWTSPIAVKGRIVVAADGKLCSWSAQ